jgi:UDP-N-acetylglucosamine--N-acetylmuramyl-(pentapeptide) pyrophosphoryl-undecaprenol N-acetylglucosamine transferase
MKNIVVFTGGGSAGHVTPNLAVISGLKDMDWEVHYIGSNDGIEQGIINEAGIPFHSISSGKLRRYFDLQNLKDPFKVVKGVTDAYRIIRKLKPKVIFSKGGFVAVPVVIAGWLSRVPVIIHESDLTPGLANKISSTFAKFICVTFPETVKHFAPSKAVLTGLPIREELSRGDAKRGRHLSEFTSYKPVLLIMGGSLGSKKINETVREQLDELLAQFEIVHICGKGNTDPELKARRGYCQIEFASSDLPDYLAMADIVVSRAGSTSIYEFLHLRKPMLLIPLSLQASRGDQIANAESFVAKGIADVLPEEKLTGETLLDAVTNLYNTRESYITAMNAYAAHDSVSNIIELILKTARR